MKVTLTLEKTAQVRYADPDTRTPYEKLDDLGRICLEGIERIRRGVSGDLVLERGELVFDYAEDVVVSFEVEPEALRTKLKSEANSALAALQDCDRCRSGDVLLPCACHQWCGNDKCLSEDGLNTVDRGPRLASPWDKESLDKWEAEAAEKEAEVAAAVAVAKANSEKARGWNEGDIQ